MSGYKHTCRYCEKLIDADSNVCPFCSKINPIGSLRCPKCKNPIQKEWKQCNSCGLNLIIQCPKCEKITFFGDYCDFCKERLVVSCSNSKCNLEQPPISDKCVKCNKPLKLKRG